MKVLADLGVSRIIEKEGSHVIQVKNPYTAQWEDKSVIVLPCGCEDECLCGRYDDEGGTL